MARPSISLDDKGSNDRFWWSRSYTATGFWWVTDDGEPALGQGSATHLAVTDDFGNLVRVPA